MSDTTNSPVTGVVVSSTPSALETFTNLPVVKYVGHLLFVAVLAGLNVLLLSLLQTASVFNVGSLPQAYQGLAYLLIPGLILAGKSLQQQLATELAQEQTAKAMADAATAKAMLENQKN